MASFIAHIAQLSDEEKSDLFCLLYDANKRVRRRFAPKSDYSVTNTLIQLYHPESVAIDSDGSIVVADRHKHQIRRIESDGQVSTLAGSGSKGWKNGAAHEAEFQYPWGVAIDNDGSIVVADWGNHQIRRIESDGQVSTLAGSGSKGFKDGAAHEAKLNFPSGVAINSDGSIVVADSFNHRIRRIEADGPVITLAGSGSKGFKDGAAHEAQFDLPSGVAINSDGSIVVADSFNHRIRQIKANGQVSTLAGSGSKGFKDGAAHEAQFFGPTGVAVGSDGSIVVADTCNHRIRQIKADGWVSTLAGSGSKGFKDGAAHEVQFTYPAGVAIGRDGCIVVADKENHRIRRIE